MKRRIILGWIAVLLALCIALSLLPASAEEPQRTVKVGYYLQDRFQMMDERTGEKSGLGYEYLQKVAQYGGFEYEYVYGDYDTLRAMMLSGEIDLLIYLSTDYYDTSAYPFGGMVMLESFYLYKRSSDSSMNYTDYDLFDGKVFGVMENTNEAKILESYFWSLEYLYEDPSEVPRFTIEYYSDESAMEADFSEGKLDVVVHTYGYSDLRSDVTRLFSIGGNMYYISTRSDETGYAPADPELAALVGDACDRFLNTEPGYADELMTRYYGDTMERLELSDPEQDYIRDHSDLRIGYLDGFLPFCGTSKDGTVAGIVADLVPEMLDTLGLSDQVNAEYRPYASWADLVGSLRSGEADVIFPVLGSPWNAEQDQISRSNAVMHPESSIVVKGTYAKDSIRSLAVNSNNAVSEIDSRKLFPGAEQIAFSSAGECLDAVRNGKTDGVILASLRAGELLKSSRYRSLSYVPLQNSLDLCFGVRRGDTELLTILNRGTYGIDADLPAAASYNYLDELYSYSARDYIADHLIVILSGLALVLAVVIIVIIAETRKRNRINRKYQSELEDARRAADEANSAKTAFLFNMSHDIRTPMNAILGYTDLAIRHPGDRGRVMDSLEKIRISGKHLLDLINDILEMSRIESGRFELTEGEVDLRRSTEAVVNMSRALADERKIEFEVSLAELPDPFVYADELHLNEILINLISNACKYTPAGGKVRYRVEQAGPASGGRAEYRFVVADNGIGMSEEFQSHLFETFSRENTAEVSQQEGAGLGLSIVKNILDRTGGSIDVRSKQGEGSEFTVVIPLRVMDPEAIRTFSKEHDKEDGTSAPFTAKGRRVLLVEDNEMNREIAEELLSEAGFLVETAENGKLALDTVAEKGSTYFDVILMDIRMPVMDGYEATRAIRGLAGGDLVPIIALSANAFKEDVAESLKAGMNAHIAKPIDLNQLLRVMTDLIGEGGALSLGSAD